MSMFQATVVGRVGSDPELRATTSGKSVATVSVCVDQYAGEGKKVALWQRCVFWGGLGERLTKYVRKGDMIAITGDVRERTWIGGDGSKNTVREVHVSNLSLLPNGRKAETAPEEGGEGAGTEEVVVPDDLP